MSTKEESKAGAEQTPTPPGAAQEAGTGASQPATAPPVTAYPATPAYPPGYPPQAAIPPTQPPTFTSAEYPRRHPSYPPRPTGGTTYVFTTPAADHPGAAPQPQTFRVEIPAAAVTYHQQVWSDPIPDCLAWLCCIFFFPFGLLALCICRHQVCIECGASRPFPA